MRYLATAIVAACSVAWVSQAAPPFKHIVIVIQENRTPDNLFGSNPTFEPGVDIATSGVTSEGKTVQLTPLALDSCYDIQHSHLAFEDALTSGFDTEPSGGNGRCTGKLPPNPHYKYVDNSSGTIQPYFDLATEYGFANRMFQTNQGPSFPAHQFLFGGTSAIVASTPLFAAENMGRKIGQTTSAGCTAPPNQIVSVIDPNGSETTNPPVFPCFERNTLGDLLSAANPPLSWRYYANKPGGILLAPNAIRHICQPMMVKGKATCTGPLWQANVVSGNPAQVLTDIADCNLPAVSWVTPTGENSDHAGGNMGHGPQWVASIVNSIGQQNCPSGESYWNDTAILITWDDWGGWYDHVKPLAVNVGGNGWGAGYTYGFRVPLLVVSAYTPAGFVDNDALDSGSILAFTEHNFGLGFIGPGDAPYGRYADYQSTQPPFGDLSTFFTLSNPRPFLLIKTAMTPRDFINAPKSTIPPDDD